MRIYFLFLFVCCALRVVAQDFACLDITLKNSGGQPDLVPASFDSVLVNKEWRQTVKRFCNVQSKNGVLTLSCLPAGRYVLSIATKTVGIAPLPVTVCSKCSNAFEFTVHPIKQAENTLVYEMIEISPVYRRGKDGIVNDFLVSLDKKERKAVTKSADFQVHFFVTKDGEVSDPSFVPIGLSSSVKNAVAKGLTGLKKWQPAELNGKVSDGEYMITKSELIGR